MFAFLTLLTSEYSINYFDVLKFVANVPFSYPLQIITKPIYGFRDDFRGVLNREN